MKFRSIGLEFDAGGEGGLGWLFDAYDSISSSVTGELTVGCVLTRICPNLDQL